jgi:hypothetical protein
MDNDMRSDVLGRISEAGWNGLRVDPRAMLADMRAAGEAARAEAAPIVRLLATEDGKYFLDWLAKKTVLRPPDEDAVAVTGMEAVSLRAKRREGQDSIWWMILHMLQAARNEKPIGGGET